MHNLDGPSVSSLDYPGEILTYVHLKMCSRIFIITSLVMVKTGNLPNVQQHVSGSVLKLWIRNIRSFVPGYCYRAPKTLGIS